MNKILLLIITTFLLASCVPNKDLIYLQGEPTTKNKIQRIQNIPYKLQVDDIIRIDIKSVNQDLVTMFQKSVTNNNAQSLGNNNSDYFLGYSVDAHGNIRLPVIGKVNVLGYTVLEVRKKLETEFLKLFKNKEDIFIDVKLSGIKYTILGEIANPGTKVIRQNSLTIIEAIANSGEITNVGNRKKIEVIRTSNNNSIQKFYIDITKITAFDSEIFFIQPNDIINVLPLPQKSLGIGTTGLQSLTTIVSVFSLLTSIIIIAKNL